MQLLILQENNIFLCLKYVLLTVLNIINQCILWYVRHFVCFNSKTRKERFKSFSFIIFNKKNVYLENWFDSFLES